MEVIRAENLVKTFAVTEKEKGLRGAVKGLFFPKRKEVCAVDDVSFSIAAGETVGYLGPNGAGKSTTIKMLCGILHPTSGHVEINGMSPQKHRRAVVKNIGVVFGQRTQLYWDLRLGESFELLKHVYRIESSVFNDNIRWMNKELGLEGLMDTPVRQLSLGQRMRGEVSAALLHSPEVLFLDEPTIGLDFEAKNALRELIGKVNRERNVTVVLTTHDLGDVEQLCRRLVVIDDGKVVEDGSFERLMTELVPFKVLEIEMERPLEDEEMPYFAHGKVIQNCGNVIRIRFDRNHVSTAMVIRDVLERVDVKDMRIREPKVEEMVMTIYKKDYRAVNAERSLA